MKIGENNKYVRMLIWKSYKKWIEIVYFEGVDRDAVNCPLCIKYTDDNCKDCPIFIESGENKCKNTPWFEWAVHQQKTHETILNKQIECDFCEKLAKEESNYIGRIYLEYFKRRNEK